MTTKEEAKTMRTIGIFSEFPEDFAHLANDELLAQYEETKNRLQEVRFNRTRRSRVLLDLEGEVSLMGRALKERGLLH